MVGALNVGSISTPWSGEIRPRAGGVVDNIDVPPALLKKGDLLGWFNMGSTVIILARDLEWLASAGADVIMGQALARRPS